MNTLVNFETSKLLKEKGFTEFVYNYFSNNGKEKHFQPKYKENYNSSVIVGLTHSRPTIADVVMWLYEKHGIWIGVECDCYGELWFSKFSIASKSLWEDDDKHPEVSKAFRKFPNEHNSPTKAYEAAINYTLNNLINYES